jgi:hypothetical protein
MSCVSTGRSLSCVSAGIPGCRLCVSTGTGTGTETGGGAVGSLPTTDLDAARGPIRRVLAPSNLSSSPATLRIVLPHLE